MNVASQPLARATDYWRAALGIAMLTIVTVMPNGLGGLLAWRTTRRDTA